MDELRGVVVKIRPDQAKLITGERELENASPLFHCSHVH